MRRLLYLFVVLVTFASCSPKMGEMVENKNQEPPADQKPIASSIDLTEVNNDRVWVQINPGKFNTDSVIFRLPRVVQGTYSVSNFGNFTDSLVAYNYDGQPITATKEGKNTWIIPNASELDKLGYYVNDTFDIENSDKATPFSPSGTNIKEDNFVLNLHGFVGYFENLQDQEYRLDITAPTEFNRTAALPVINTTYSRDSTEVTNTYAADRYFQVTDNPMMYGNLDVAKFMVDDMQIVLSVYSPNGNHSASSIQKTIKSMMDAQKDYLGTLKTTDRYDIYLYLAPRSETAPTGFGALEHHTSTVVVLPEAMPASRLNQTMTDVVSHEFFHIVTPLNVHSEDVHYFDYNAPTFSKHLWMYEGVTEYFASHFQVYEGLQSKQEFYDKMNGKIASSLGMNDSMSFTKMSENILEEPYASNYYNVYQKGALIGMCIDILMREESNGKRSMMSLMTELSQKYGTEKPFTDDKLISEITTMTYPSVGDFLQTHVVGNTPIDYNVFFDKVGLERVKDSTQTSLFLKGQTPFIKANQEEGKVEFRDIELNSSLKRLGVQSGDIIKSVNGTEYSLQNIRQLIPESMGWSPDTDIKMVVIRGDQEITLSGKVGTPMVEAFNLKEVEEANEDQLKLRKQWLGQ
ncbi:peptidase M61 [Aliifodinibius salicampi]|uniref:Peptidase M61 n=1 Tax=Fodinibius salicampi TaxID=1920655 RepID=A0ABT3Q2Y7_9BACT|nr:peptidase M61 [Fodinibius salicampi]MCW9714464.1 peptidase M61 [Fodinibius salicampi]